MTDTDKGYVYDPLDRSSFEAIAYNAVGRGSEINTFPAYHLSHSTSGSGWSVGLMQWDFGQPGRQHKVDELLAGYQACVSAKNRFSEQEIASLSTRLRTRGQHGNSLSANEQERLNDYLRSDAGRAFVDGLDREQVAYKWEQVGQPLSQIPWLQELRKTDPGQAAEIVVMTSKRFNQGESRGRELIGHLQSSEMTSDDLSQWIADVSARAPANSSAITSGRDNALDAVRLINALELGEGRLSVAWHDQLYINGNTGLTQGFNSNPDVQLLDAMMRSPSAGARILAAVDRGEAVQAVAISGVNAEARLEMAHVDMDRDGVLTVLSPDGDRYRMTREGWDRNGIPMHEIGDYERRVQPFFPIAPIASTPGRIPRDPRDPAHPDHVLQQNVRGKVQSLYAGQGVVLSDEQIDCTTACVMADARRARMTGVTALAFSEDRGTGRPDLNGKIIAWQGNPDNPASRYSVTSVQGVAAMAPDEAYRQFAQDSGQQARWQAPSAGLHGQAGERQQSGRHHSA